MPTTLHQKAQASTTCCAFPTLLIMIPRNSHEPSAKPSHNPTADPKRRMSCTTHHICTCFCFETLFFSLPTPVRWVSDLPRIPQSAGAPRFHAPRNPQCASPRTASHPMAVCQDSHRYSHLVKSYHSAPPPGVRRNTLPSTPKRSMWYSFHGCASLVRISSLLG